MSETVSNTQSAQERLALIEDLEAILAMCRMKHRAKGQTTFDRWMIATVGLGFFGVVGLILMQPYALVLVMLAMIAWAIGMCNFPIAPTMTKEECAQVFSRFNHLPDREALLERYAQCGTLSYQEVTIPLNKALYDLRMAARKAEIMELAKGVKDIPSKAE